MASNKITKESLVKYIQEQVENLHKLHVLNEQKEQIQKEIRLLEEGRKKKKGSEYSEAGREFVAKKMRKMADEDKPQDQKAAIALSMARKKGLKVPAEKNESTNPTANLSKSEQQILNDILGTTLNEGFFDNMIEKVKSYAKKGLMTAAILTSLLATPNLSQAQQSQLKQAAQIEMSDQKVGDLELGKSLIQAYEKNPSAAEQWFKVNKSTGIVDNIKSVIKTGKDQGEIKDLGNMYQNNQVAKEFLRHMNSL